MRKIIAFVLFIAIVAFACQESSSILEPSNEFELEKNIERVDTMDGRNSTQAHTPGRPVIPRI